MKKRNRPNRLAAALAGSLALLLPATGPAQTYLLTDLGSNSWSYSEAHGLNGLGSVVGEYETTNFFYVLGFLYSNSVMTEVGHLGGVPYAIAYGINDSTQVVGESDTANSTHAFLYSNGTMTDLGTLGTLGGYSSAHAINGLSHIVGESSLTDASVIHAVLYNAGTKTDLGALGGNYSSANAINGSDTIVGESDVVSSGVTNVHAFLYINGTMTDLGTLGGNYSSAKGINDSGVIVGEAETVIGGVTSLHGFVYRNGVMSDLGTLGGTVSSASAINNTGQIVGYSTDANGVSYAFLDNGSQMVNLNSFIPAGSGWTNLASADAINDAGQIAGSGYLADGSYHAYLLTPAAPLNILITNPPANATFQAPASFVVSATVSDSAGTVTNVQFRVNSTVIGQATSAPFNANATNLTTGVYTLTAEAMDNTGLKATNTITVTVTDAPPTIAITNPISNSVFEAPATFAIGAMATDSDGTVTNVQFLVNGNPIGSSTSIPYTATAVGLGAGGYMLTAIAFDNAGLTATNSLSISVTDAPPSVTITNPAPGAAFEAPATFAVGASASDPDGTVTNVEFLLNGNALTNVSVAPYAATVTNLPAGSYLLAAIASDNGGLEASNSISITVTNGLLTSIVLSNAAFNGSNFTFTFDTRAGYSYQGEFNTLIGGTNGWVVFTNLSGDGSVATVSDSTPTNTQRFYRVVAH